MTEPIAPAAAALLAPRWAIALVTSWKAERPWSLNPKVTLGALVVESKPCFGLVMSVPESAGWSRSAYQPGGKSPGGTALPSESVGDSETTIVPTGTLTTIPSWGRFFPVGLT